MAAIYHRRHGVLPPSLGPEVPGPAAPRGLPPPVRRRRGGDGRRAAALGLLAQHQGAPRLLLRALRPPRAHARARPRTSRSTWARCRCASRPASRSVELGPRDAAVLNDPYRGGTHLPDVTLVTPVYLPGRRRPDFYCANRAHHADVGGASPGSMAPAADVHGEGLRIPPIAPRPGRAARPRRARALARQHARAARARGRPAGPVGRQPARARGAWPPWRRSTALAELERRGRELLDWAEDLTGAFLGRLPRAPRAASRT